MSQTTGGAVRRGPGRPGRRISIALVAMAGTVALFFGALETRAQDRHDRDRHDRAPHERARQPRSDGGRIAGRVTLLSDGERVSNASSVVAYLEGVPGRVPRSARVRRRITQRGRQFTPRLLVVPVGSTIDFPNDDRIYHNVFSLSRTKRFDLGLYRSGASKSVTFRRPGIVDVYCNIHPEMEAKILVLDTIHYDRADRRGRFVIDGVPPGTYTLVGWQAHSEPYRREVTVRSGETTNVSFQVRARDERRKHTRKDGTPYGRYR